MTTAITTGDEIRDLVVHAYRDELERNRRTPTPHREVWATGMRECTRRMVYDLTVPDQQLPFDVETLARFRRGDARSVDVLMELTRAGRHATPPFDILGREQKFDAKDRKGRTVIVGRVDAHLAIEKFRAPIEVKAYSPYLVDRIETSEDVFASPYTRSAAYQLPTYLYLMGVPFGLWVFDRSGIPKIIPCELDRHLDKVEEFLTRAELALDHVEAGTLPDYLNDPDECLRCPYYGTVCDPPLVAPSMVQVISDPDLQAALDRREELRKPGKAYKELDEEIKQRLRGITNAVIGPYAIRGYWAKQSRLDLPLDVKQKYTRVDPQGRFILHIERHG